MLPLAILAGGFATRLGALTKDTPKSLLEVNGRPFIDWQLELLVKNGYSKFILCVSYKSALIQEYLGNGSERGISIQYSLDGEEQLGTGGAIKKALPILGDKFGVIYGDSYLPINYRTVEQNFLTLESPALMVVYKNQNQFDASNVEFIDGKVVDYEKKARNRKMRHIDFGITYFRGEAFSPWKYRSTFDLSEVCNYLIREKKLDGFEVYERFYEIGSKEGILELSRYLRKVKSEL